MSLPVLPLYALPLYMIWLAALGAIGSISFIGMNALAVQTDVTFDLTNTKLIVMQIVLGALFEIVLTLPFGFGSFMDFLFDLQHGAGKVSFRNCTAISPPAITFHSSDSAHRS